MAKFLRRIELEVGHAEFDDFDQIRIGDRLVGRVIRVSFPGADGQPKLAMTIDSSSGVPLCTDLRITAVENGREVRTTDLRAVEINQWVEAIVALAADEIISSGPGGTNSVIRVPDTESEDFQAAKRTIRAARRSARRSVTPELLRRVAETYAAQTDHGVESVEAAFGTSYRTAARYVQLARADGLLPEKGAKNG